MPEKSTVSNFLRPSVFSHILLLLKLPQTTLRPRAESTLDQCLSYYTELKVITDQRKSMDWILLTTTTIAVLRFPN